MNGQDIFDANYLHNEKNTKIFYKIIGYLKELIINNNKVSSAHNFIDFLNKKKKLLRCYTQNIDNLEEKLNLNLNNEDKNCNVVQLHGTLKLVRCSLCSYEIEFCVKLINIFKRGETINCPNCIEFIENRKKLGKRTINNKNIGYLRPSIVLYNEHNPNDEIIGKLQVLDINKKPDLLIIMGSSLKVYGIKNFIKILSKIVHNFKNGKVIFINNGNLNKSFNKIIDLHFKMDIDYFIKNIMLRLKFNEYFNYKEIVNKITPFNKINYKRFYSTPTLFKCKRHENYNTPTKKRKVFSPYNISKFKYIDKGNILNSFKTIKRSSFVEINKII